MLHKKEGFSWTISRFKEYLGIKDKYKEWKNLNLRVIKPAYEELHEKANLWFEYDIEKDKQGNPYKINVKIVRGYYTVKDSPDFSAILEQETDIKFTLDYSTLGSRARDCFYILKHKLLINDINIIGEIVLEKLDEFYIWWETNEKKIEKQANPASMLLFYLNMTAKKGWLPRRWRLINETPESNNVKTDDYTDVLNCIRLELKNNLGELTYKTWFSTLQINNIDAENKKIVIKVPSVFVMDTIEDKYLEQFRDALEKVLGVGYSLTYNI